MEDRWVEVSFDRPFHVRMHRKIAPYGLVAKANRWFVVWAGEDGRLRVDQVARILAAAALEERFDRSEGFDLDVFWTQWRDRQEASRSTFDVRLRVRRDAVEFVEDALGPRRGVFYAVPAPADEWVTMDVSFSFLGEARTEVLAFGGAVEVMAPEALRRSVIDFAEQISTVYRSRRLTPKRSNV